MEAEVSTEDLEDIFGNDDDSRSLAAPADDESLAAPIETVDIDECCQ